MDLDIQMGKFCSLSESVVSCDRDEVTQAPTVKQ